MNRCENHGDTKDGSSQIIQVQAMEFTYYYASIYFEAVKIFFLKKPKEPPRGCITSLLVGAFIIGIFSCLTMIGIARMTFRTKTMDSKGVFEASQDCHDTLHSEGDDTIITKPTMNAYALTTCLADVDQERMNTQVPFDTDSIFFVCDNSSTGHICNDVSKFVPGTMRDTLRRLTTANGTGPCLREGTVRVHLNDDN